MFGLGKKEAAVNDADKYMRSMVAGLGAIEGKKLPSQAFADPYVAAFLQVLVVHATAVVYKGKMPDQMTVAGIMAAAMERMVPGYGSAVVNGVVEIGNPSHAQHTHYQVGRKEGTDYVRALMAGDQVSQDEAMRSFREYLTKHYL